MKLKEKWDYLPLHVKVTIMISGLAIVLIGLLGLVVFQSRKSSSVKSNSDRLTAHTIDIYNMLDINHKASPERVDLATLLVEKDMSYLEEKLLDTRYLNSGFPFLIDSRGNIILHPTDKGTNIAETHLFRQIQKQKNGDFSYIWPEKSNTGKKNRLFFRFYEPYETYVAVTVSEYDFVRKTMWDTLRLILIAMLIATVVFVATISMIMSRITLPINNIADTLEKLSMGILVDNFKTYRKDEIGKIANSLNKLINGLKSTAVFANEIEKNNFKHDFTPLSGKDVLGNALIDMRKSLEAAFYEDEKRKEEDKKHNWTTEGLARFSDILRLNNDNMEELSFNIIQNLVTYLRINQGGLFILNDDHESDKFLELASCYAFDRKKYLTKKIEIGEGLTGACYLEKKSIYLKKIPDDYLVITSGLGDAPPQTLLIVPLLLNDEVYGVLELASFKDFEIHEIDFVEKIAESIASTLSGVKINMRTAILLEQSQQQSEEMRAQEEEMRQNMEEMQATQEEMARKEAELTGLFNTINDSLLYAEFSTQRSFINANQKLVKLLSLTTNDIIGKKHIEINARFLSPKEYEELWEKLLTGGIVNRESQVNTQAGNIWLDETYAPVTNQRGEVYKILLIARDITRVKELEMKLKNLEK